MKLRIRIREALLAILLIIGIALAEDLRKLVLL